MVFPFTRSLYSPSYFAYAYDNGLGLPYLAHGRRSSSVDIRSCFLVDHFAVLAGVRTMPCILRRI